MKRNSDVPKPAAEPATRDPKTTQPDSLISKGIASFPCQHPYTPGTTGCSRRMMGAFDMPGCPAGCYPQHVRSTAHLHQQNTDMLKDAMAHQFAELKGPAPVIKCLLEPPTPEPPTRPPTEINISSALDPAPLDHTLSGTSTQVCGTAVTVCVRTSSRSAKGIFSSRCLLVHSTNITRMCIQIMFEFLCGAHQQPAFPSLLFGMVCASYQHIVGSP